jgi:hypothetical protein
MASENIKVENGRFLVERDGRNKTSLDLALSDVDSYSFERGGEGENESDGTLTLFTKDKEYYTVRVADNEVGKYLKQIHAAQEKPATKEKAAPAKSNEDTAK